MGGYDQFLGLFDRYDRDLKDEEAEKQHDQAVEDRSNAERDRQIGEPRHGDVLIHESDRYQNAEQRALDEYNQKQKELEESLAQVHEDKEDLEEKIRRKEILEENIQREIAERDALNEEIAEQRAQERSLDAKPLNTSQAETAEALEQSASDLESAAMAEKHF